MLTGPPPMKETKNQRDLRLMQSDDLSPEKERVFSNEKTPKSLIAFQFPDVKNKQNKITFIQHFKKSSK